MQIEKLNRGTGKAEIVELTRLLAETISAATGIHPEAVGETLLQGDKIAMNGFIFKLPEQQIHHGRPQ